MTPATSVAQRRRALFVSLVGPHLERLRRFVGQELAYFQAVGILGKGELTTDDVVDAVLLSAYREFVKDRGVPEIRRSWLMRLAIKQIESEVRRLASERGRTVHIEDDVPDTPPAEAVSTLGEEILYFYEPDEDLKLEDVIADLDVPSPEEKAATEELRQCVNAALTAMPKEWRRVLLLRHVDGLTGAELAATVGTTKAQVKRLLESAREDLRRRLLESGCTFRAHDSAHDGR